MNFYRLWQHQETAEVWAIRWDWDGHAFTVTGGAGPLAVAGLGGSLAKLSYTAEAGARLAASEEEYFPYAGCAVPGCKEPAVVLGADGHTRTCLYHDRGDAESRRKLGRYQDDGPEMPYDPGG